MYDESFETHHFMEKHFSGIDLFFSSRGDHDDPNPDPVIVQRSNQGTLDDIK